MWLFTSHDTSATFFFVTPYLQAKQWMSHRKVTVRHETRVNVRFFNSFMRMKTACLPLTLILG